MRRIIAESAVQYSPVSNCGLRLHHRFGLEPMTSAALSPKRESTTLLWMGTAFVVALGLAAAVFATRGLDIVQALRMTARWSFLLFWLAYTGGALAALFGPAFRPLAAHGRDLGLAYASAQLVHLGLVIWLFQISSSPPLSGGLYYFFVLAIVMTYLLAIFSIGGLSKTLGSKGWRALRIVGLNYILLAFARDFVPPAFQGIADHGASHFVSYAPFAAMCIAGPILVLTAAAYRWAGARYSQARFGTAVN
jgi:hypothetical protein